MMKTILDQTIPGAPNFKWKEVLWLNQWQVYVFPSVPIEDNLAHTMAKMQKIRKILGNYPITITSAYRPATYNRAIGGAKQSAHMKGRACDFQVHGYDECDTVRGILYPYLEQLDIRMEDLPGANWVHIDTMPVIHKRFFKP